MLALMSGRRVGSDGFNRVQTEWLHQIPSQIAKKRYFNV